MKNRNQIINALYQLEESVLSEGLSPILEEYQIVEDSAESVCLQSFEFRDKRQMITSSRISLKDKATGEVFIGNSVLVGEKIKKSRLLAICDAIVNNQLYGTLVVVSLMDEAMKNKRLAPSTL